MKKLCINLEIESKPGLDGETKIAEKVYFGESSESGYWRGLQHTSDFLRKSETSHMWKHVTEAHPGSEPRDVKFGINVVREHFSAFLRLIFEAVLIFCFQSRKQRSQLEG